MARRSSLRGDFKLRRTLRNIHKTMDNELRPTMQKCADRILGTMQELIPKDTGEAAAALRAYVAPSGLDAQIGIRGKRDNQRFYYLRFVEYGTKGYAGGKRADKRNRRATNKSDGTHFSASTRISRLVRPTLAPASDAGQSGVRPVEIEAAIARTLRRASQGA